MFLLNKVERKYFRLLIAIVIICGIINLLSTPVKISLKDVILTGNQTVIIENNGINKEVKNIIQDTKAKPESVIINESPIEDIICCPGIGKNKAEQIIKERQLKPFFDWRDFQDRIKGISNTQIEILKNAGVRLN